MPGQIRPDAKTMKLAYKIMKTPKNLRQDSKVKPPKKMLDEWYRDSVVAQ